MDDAAARLLAERALLPSETLIWSEAAPASPDAIIYFVWTLVLIAAVIGAFWYGLSLWPVFRPSIKTLSKRLHKVIAWLALGLVSIALVGIIVLAAFGALFNGAKVLIGSAAAYAITDKQAFFVYDAAGAPYVDPLVIDLVQIDRSGNDLRLRQPLSTTLFGVTYDPVFRDLDDAAAVETMLRTLARQTTGRTTPEAEANLPTETRAALTPALFADETVLWAQHAEGHPKVIGASAQFIFFGLFGVGLLLAVFWPKGVVAVRESPGARLIMAPIGAALILAAIANAGWSFGSGDITYALTDRRVVVARTAPWRDSRDYDPAYFDEVRVDHDRISFCRVAVRRPCSDRYITGVRNAEAVAAQMRTAFAHQRERAPAAPNAE